MVLRRRNVLEEWDWKNARAFLGLHDGMIRRLPMVRPQHQDATLKGRGICVGVPCRVHGQGEQPGFSAATLLFESVCLSRAFL
jgi:hypothetical protein